MAPRTLAVLRKTLNQVDTPNHGQGEVKTKGLAKCFPYVNQLAGSALGLLSLYVSIMFSKICEFLL